MNVSLIPSKSVNFVSHKTQVSALGSCPKLGTRITATRMMSSGLLNSSEQQSISEHPTPLRSARFRHMPVRRSRRKADRLVDLPQFKSRRRSTAMLQSKKMPPATAINESHEFTTRRIFDAVPPEITTTSIARVAMVTEPSAPTSLVSESNVSDLRVCPTGIVTNPYLRRRYSAEGGPTSTNQTWRSPNKRTRPDNFSRESGGSINPPRLASTPRILFPVVRDSDRVPEASSRRNNTSDMPSKRLRHSAGIIQSNETPVNRVDKHPVRKKRSSSIMVGIRRSARQTLNSIKKVLRPNSFNLSELSVPDSKKSFFVSLSSLTAECATTDVKIYSTPIKQQSGGHLRTVNVTRASPYDPFGIFVVKSDRGFRITRLSSRVACDNQLHLGDELCLVNNHPCSSMSMDELRQIFGRATTLSLTVQSHLPLNR